MDFDEKDRRALRLREGDLLICEGGEPGRAAIWRGELEECYYQKALHRARPYSGIANSEYLAALLFQLAKGGCPKRSRYISDDRTPNRREAKSDADPRSPNQVTGRVCSQDAGHRYASGTSSQCRKSPRYRFRVASIQSLRIVSSA